MALTKMTPHGEVAMTPNEELSFLADQAAIQSGAAAQDARNRAAALLAASDITVLRCYEHGVAVPAEWATYRAALRTIRDSGTGDFPSAPSYPAGT